MNQADWIRKRMRNLGRGRGCALVPVGLLFGALLVGLLAGGLAPALGPIPQTDVERVGDGVSVN